MLEISPAVSTTTTFLHRVFFKETQQDRALQNGRCHQSLWDKDVVRYTASTPAINKVLYNTGFTYKYEKPWRFHDQVTLILDTLLQLLHLLSSCIYHCCCYSYRLSILTLLLVLLLTIFRIFCCCYKYHILIYYFYCYKQGVPIRFYCYYSYKYRYQECRGT